MGTPKNLAHVGPTQKNSEIEPRPASSTTMKARISMFAEHEREDSWAIRWLV